LQHCGAQDTTTPLKISAASNLSNAIVDPIRIFTSSLGVTGAAVATALAEACYLILSPPMLIARGRQRRHMYK
jgi:Na+-driven multidrug efflux pump